MLGGRRIVVVLPAYNAGRTLERTVAAIPEGVADEILVVDDASADDTVEVARRLGLPCLVHRRNLGYGGNQKTCYAAALERGADVVVMLHPDYQYDPRLVPALAWPIVAGVYDVVLGSRVLGRGALAGGMPVYKYFANRALTAFENLMLGMSLSEYHTGYRAFAREVLETLPLAENSDDFVFDNQVLAQAVWFGFRVGEVSAPARYAPESSSIGFARAVRYGFGVLATAAAFRAARWGLLRPRQFRADGRRLSPERLVRETTAARGGAAGEVP